MRIPQVGTKSLLLAMLLVVGSGCGQEMEPGARADEALAMSVEPVGQSTAGLTCNGTAGQWNGCRGTGCSVCAEKVADYPYYFQRHPSCQKNTICYGLYYQCNAACPAPTEADRYPPTPVCGNGICETNEVCAQDCGGTWCGDGFCDPNETRYSCNVDCGSICQSYCSNGSCCPSSGVCSDGRFCW
ncbi:hypothetical protein [Archangium violaceum]|uniref:hypothetical protein n=1 Tax=Archangium violaceum TaxID=83451 RepID=UPI0036DC76BE